MSQRYKHKDDIVVELELDVKGLNCPLPLLKAKQALNRLETGQTVKVVATDPGSERDFGVFVEQSNNVLLNFEKNSSVYCYWIQKS